MINKIFLTIMFCCIKFASASYSCDTALINFDTLVACTTKNDEGIILSVRNYKNNKKDGFTKEWFKNGHLKYIRQFQNGCAIDTSIEYYENGQVKQLTPYKNCECEGVFITFFENGDTASKGLSQNGKSIGMHYSWFSNRKLQSSTYYNDSGKKHGLSQQWREDGTRKDSIMYDNDNIIEFRDYYTNGKIHMHHKVVGKNTKLFNGEYFDPDGKKCGELKNSTGTFIDYSEDGATVDKVVMKDGEIIKTEPIKGKN